MRVTKASRALTEREVVELQVIRLDGDAEFCSTKETSCIANDRAHEAEFEDVGVVVEGVHREEAGEVLRDPVPGPTGTAYPYP